MTTTKTSLLFLLSLSSVVAAPSPRGPDGDGSIAISGELRQWHKVVLSLAGPFACEDDTRPNPFTDYRFTVVFTHESGQPGYRVPGYFAADGAAAETSAAAGNVWRAHLAPDRPGRWDYRVEFTQGSGAALDDTGAPLPPFHGRTGSFTVAPTDKTGRDFRARGRLVHTGGHYLRFAGSGEIFLKAGADAPETLLAFRDFDGTIAHKASVPLKTWAPHLRDWRPGDPSWQDGKGRGLIGALDYLAAKGVNSISFLTYNAGGDGDNVWPFVARDDKLHYDCSKLDQWGIVFDHATRLGLFLHFKLQETENDDERTGIPRRPGAVPAALDGGATGTERRLYLRELVARFGHALALNWNLGEENTQTPDEQRAMARFLRAVDPYAHPIVMHTYPREQDLVYSPHLGDARALTGVSLQNPWSAAHARVLHWRNESARAGLPWVVCNDEQNPSRAGVPPDPGYAGSDGWADDGARRYDLHAIRQATLWGTLLAGGAGVEYYFGNLLPQSDMLCEDWRSRDRSWDYARIALEFFARGGFPLDRMRNADELVGNPQHDNSRYCFAKPGELYLVYLPTGGAATLDLTGAPGDFSLEWFNPRVGGPLQTGAVSRVAGGAPAALGLPPADPSEDWLAIVRIVR